MSPDFGYRKGLRRATEPAAPSPVQKPVVYLSGPISLGGSCTEEEIAAFTETFAMEASRLRRSGYEVINPCDCPHEDSWADYMRHGMRAVADADIVAVLPRWAESRGAALEVFVATQLSIPVLPVADVAPAVATSGSEAVPDSSGSSAAPEDA